MKRALTAICLGLGLSCIAAALYTSPKADITVSATKDYVSPTLLSQINTDDYVVLPVLEGITVQEQASEDQEDYSSLEQEMIRDIVTSAPEMKEVEKKTTIIADYTVSGNGKFIEGFTDSVLGIGTEQIPEKLEKSLLGAKKGISVNIEGLEGFYEDKKVDVYMTIKSIHDIEYPIPDSYMSSNTEYESVSDMVRMMVNEKESKKRADSRQNTLNQLLDVVFEKTTFTDLPESLVEEEIAVLEKEGNDDTTYQAAEKNLRKLLMLKRLIEQHSIVSISEMETRLQDYEESAKTELSEYEKERRMILLSEEDVVNYLYKQIEVIEEPETLEN